MANYKDTLNYSKKVINLIADEAQKSYYTKLADGIANAIELAVDPADESRKEAQLAFNAMSLASQATFVAFVAGDLTDELEKEFRELPTLVALKKALDYEVEKARAEEDALTAQLNAFRERGRQYDIVLAVCAGRSVEEAKKMQAEYEKKVAQQMQG